VWRTFSGPRASPLAFTGCYPDWLWTRALARAVGSD